MKYPERIRCMIPDIEEAISKWPVDIEKDNVVNWILQFDNEDYDLGLRIIKNLNVIGPKDLEYSLEVAYSKLMRKAIEKGTSRVERILEQLLQGLNVKVTQYDNMQFCWRMDQDPEQYGEYRVAPADEEKRSMDDISPKEISNAIKAVVELQISLSRTDLIRETAKVFGFTRMGNIIKMSVNQGIKEALRRGWISLSDDGERVSLPVM
ncbi:hypothetical protein R2R35_01030 [Anaerocolumna sp. AGMB13020]|uniref:hypothetical protein n=1 Tax=Anaerocolumna sp. AGMB13020 TaxID=3081750 RepID=UPI0029551612|nr:hypothetical protein [Anaerocolumna sp. AGMB13020]WOO37107.1 hypothetical protein R2R35_01030 [Anaerocolumna sp. AGMB13020]